MSTPPAGVTARFAAMQARFGADVADLLERLQGAVRILSERGLNADALITALQTVRAAKDAARYVGQAAFAEIAQELETVLMEARNGHVTFTQETAVLLLTAVDLLRYLASPRELPDPSAVGRVADALRLAVQPSAPRQAHVVPPADSVYGEDIPNTSDVLTASEEEIASFGGVVKKPRPRRRAPMETPAPPAESPTPAPVPDVSSLLSAVDALGIHLQTASAGEAPLAAWRESRDAALYLRQQSVADVLREIAQSTGAVCTSPNTLMADADVVALLREILLPAVAAAQSMANDVRVTAKSMSDLLEVRVVSTVAPPVPLSAELRERLRLLRGDMRLSATLEENVLTLRFPCTPLFARLLLFHAADQRWAIPLASLISVSPVPAPASIPSATLAQIAARDFPEGHSRYALLLGFNEPEAALLVDKTGGIWEGEIQPTAAPLLASPLFCGVVRTTPPDLFAYDALDAACVTLVLHVPEWIGAIRRCAKGSI